MAVTFGLPPIERPLPATLLDVIETEIRYYGPPDAGLLARLGKATGIDTAVQAVTDLAPLIGASGFQRNHPAAKAHADLTGLLYADGIHDSLYRSGGVTLLASAVLAHAAAPITPQYRAT